MRRPPTINGVSVPYGAPVAELRRAVAAPGPSASAAFAALSADAGSESLAALVEAAASPDWRMRRAAVEAVAGHVLGRTAARLVLDALGDDSPYVVRTACDAAAALRLDDAHDVVLGLTRSPDAATRECATRGLDALWRASDFDATFEAMLRDSVLDVRRRAGFVLRAHADATTWNRLVAVWRADELPRARRWACDLTAAFGGADDVAALEPLTRDRDGHVRKAAARATAALSERRRGPER
jgi:HEAT repeat protein